MKRKKIIVSILAVSALIICIKYAHMYYEYKQEEKRLAQEPYFTEYKMSFGELLVMVCSFYVDENPDIDESVDKEQWPDYTYYTIEATEDTEMAVAVLNYCLYDDFMESDRAGLEKAKEYGFSSENRITVDWVMSHPKEAVQIMESMWEKGDFFDDYQDVKKLYDENIVVPEVDATE